jgi:5'-nucleotidase
MRILLTNDDGVDAPALIPFLRELGSQGRVDVVVPDRERSWVAKAITRFDPVTVEVREISGHTVHACSGYPADCVQLGIHTLFEERPDIVVSGVNIGYNHGSAYLQASGTAGAALEAGVSRVPAIAISTGSAEMPWADWKQWVAMPDATPMWERVARVAAGLVGELAGALGPGEILNVGIPDAATSETPRRLTRVAKAGYDRLFAEVSDGVYTHAYGGLVHDEEGMEGTDVGAAADGAISVTPIQGPGDAAVPEAIAALLDHS